MRKIIESRHDGDLAAPGVLQRRKLRRLLRHVVALVSENEHAGRSEVCPRLAWLAQISRGSDGRQVRHRERRRFFRASPGAGKASTGSRLSAPGR